MPLGLTVLPPRAPNKTPAPNRRNLFLSFWLGKLNRLSNQYRLLLLPLLACQRWMVKPLPRETSCTSDTVRTHKIQARSDLKPPPQGLASIVPEGAMQAAKDGNNQYPTQV